MDRGITQRRHIRVEKVEYIGKEANRWEERWHLGDDPEYQILYGASPDKLQEMVNDLLERCQEYGIRKTASASNVSVWEVSHLVNGRAMPEPETVAKLKQGIQKLEKQHQEHERHIQDVVTAFKQRCQNISVRQFASIAGVHYPHLIEVLAGHRSPSLAMLSRLEAALHQQPPT